MRTLVWDGYLNCRDLGGLATPSGSTQPGRVARGPRRELLTTTGWAQARAWGLHTVIDLRCADEVGARDGDPGPDTGVLDGIDIILSPTEDHASVEFRQVCFPILDSPEYWPHNLRILPGMVRRTLETIACAEPGILIHCSAGRDRTGMITTLLLANAGVAPDVIADDYAESVRAMAGAQTHSPTHDRQSLWNSGEAADWLAKSCRSSSTSPPRSTGTWNALASTTTGATASARSYSRPDQDTSHFARGCQRCPGPRSSASSLTFSSPVPCGVWPGHQGGTPSPSRGHRWSGRQDSNLRSPAPKAGALATTLRPGDARQLYRAGLSSGLNSNHASGSAPVTRPSTYAQSRWPRALLATCA